MLGWQVRPADARLAGQGSDPSGTGRSRQEQARPTDRSGRLEGGGGLVTGCPHCGISSAEESASGRSPGDLVHVHDVHVMLKLWFMYDVIQ